MQTNDEKLWRIARQRASFKRHAMVYLAVNAFLWIMWFIKEDRVIDSGIPWPAFTTLGWGIGLFFHGLRAYAGGQTLEEKEYQKLKNNNN